MNKDELLQALSATTALPRRRADLMLRTVFETLSRGLAAGERIEVRNFGHFAVRRSRAHTGRHPRTGAERPVPAQRSVLFRPGKALKASLNAARPKAGTEADHGAG